MADDLPIFCINLERAAKRRELMHLRWNVERGFNVRFHTAFDRRRLGVANYFSRQLNRELSSGEVACTISHFELLQHCEGRFNEIVVLEDDAIPMVDKTTLVNRIRQACAEFPSAQFIHLGSFYERSSRGNQIYSVRKVAASAGTKAPAGAFAYYLTSLGISTFRYCLQSLQLPADIPQDVWFAARGLFATLNQPIAVHPIKGSECCTYIGNQFRRSPPRKYLP